MSIMQSEIEDVYPLLSLFRVVTSTLERENVNIRRIDNCFLQLIQ